jgi:hypothetical protein
MRIENSAQRRGEGITASRQKHQHQEQQQQQQQQLQPPRQVRWPHLEPIHRTAALKCHRVGQPEGQHLLHLPMAQRPHDRGEPTLLAMQQELVQIRSDSAARLNGRASERAGASERTGAVIRPPLTGNDRTRDAHVLTQYIASCCTSVAHQCAAS